MAGAVAAHESMDQWDATQYYRSSIACHSLYYIFRRLFHLSMTTFFVLVFLSVCSHPLVAAACTLYLSPRLLLRTDGSVQVPVPAAFHKRHGREKAQHHQAALVANPWINESMHLQQAMTQDLGGATYSRIAAKLQLRSALLCSALRCWDGVSADRQAGQRVRNKGSFPGALVTDTC